MASALYLRAAREIGSLDRAQVRLGGDRRHLSNRWRNGCQLRQRTNIRYDLQTREQTARSPEGSGRAPERSAAPAVPVGGAAISTSRSDGTVGTTASVAAATGAGAGLAARGSARGCIGSAVPAGYLRCGVNGVIASGVFSRIADGKRRGRAQQLELAVPRVHDEARADRKRRHLREVLMLQLRRSRHQLAETLRLLAGYVITDVRLNQLRQQFSIALRRS